MMPHPFPTRTWAILALGVFAAPALAQVGPVHYHVDLTHAATQHIHVRMTLRGVSGPTLDVHLPVWRPGLYLVLDAAGTVRDVRASGPDGPDGPVALPIEKNEKSTWRVRCGDRDTVEISYTVWAGSLENRTRHADDTHAFISPSAVLMYAHAWRDLPAEVSLTMPDGWRVATGLRADDAGLLHADNYDVLADSPIEAGLHDRRDFDVDGVPHLLATWTSRSGPYEDSGLPGADRFAKLPADLAAIVRAQRDVFGSLPYDRYVFLLHCVPGVRGGTEHLNSTIIQTSPDSFTSDDAYVSLLSLASHEIFHTWNVKRFRPAGLVPYDYQRENYTELLWIAEGTTTYYEDLLVTRAGLMRPDRYLSDLADMIDRHLKRPGRNVQSVAESSFDAWIKHNRRWPDSPNSTVSFYDKGQLVSLILDLEIRARTENQRSLDTLMRTLYERFPTPDRGYTTADVKTALHEIAGDFEDFFRTAIDGTDELDFAAALATVGVEFEAPRALRGAPPDPAPGAHADPRADAAYLGLTVTDQAGLTQVSTVYSDGPAHHAGIVPGDAIVALNGRRIRADGWNAAIDRLSPGDRVHLSYFRFDVLREVEFTASAGPRGAVKLRRVSDPTEEQKRAYEAWLGQPWPAR